MRHVRVPEEWVIVRYMRCNAYTITNKLEKVVNVESFLQGAPNVIGHKLARVLSVAASAERRSADAAPDSPAHGLPIRFCSCPAISVNH